MALNNDGKRARKGGCITKRRPQCAEATQDRGNKKGNVSEVPVQGSYARRQFSPRWKSAYVSEQNTASIFRTDNNMYIYWYVLQARGLCAVETLNERLL
jgi:hypothetical protein